MDVVLAVAVYVTIIALAVWDRYRREFPPDEDDMPDWAKEWLDEWKDL